MISVLIADDSFFMRKLIGDILSADPEIRVVGTAADGEQAVALANKLQPDVVTMDLDMPKLNGLDATKRIMRDEVPRPIVVMLSAYTKAKANESLECLRAGAFSCVLKPSGPLSLNIETVEKELIEQVKAAARSRKEALRRPPARPRSPGKKSAAAHGAFPLIVMGASTGGPPVLEEIFSSLQRQPEAAVLVVQHMPEKFTASLAERLDAISPLKVKQAEEGEAVKPGVAFVAPGDQHMRIERRKEGSRTEYVIRLSRDAPAHGLRPSIDILAASVARCFDGALLGIILTGMGRDGADGMKELQDHGAAIIIQEPDTCVVDSMVRATAEECESHERMSPERIAKRVESFTLMPAS